MQNTLNNLPPFYVGAPRIYIPLLNNVSRDRERTRVSINELIKYKQ